MISVHSLTSGLPSELFGTTFWMYLCGFIVPMINSYSIEFDIGGDIESQNSISLSIASTARLESIDDRAEEINPRPLLRMDEQSATAIQDVLLVPVSSIARHEVLISKMMWLLRIPERDRLIQYWMSLFCRLIFSREEFLSIDLLSRGPKCSSGFIPVMEIGCFANDPACLIFLQESLRRSSGFFKVHRVLGREPMFNACTG